MCRGMSREGLPERRSYRDCPCMGAFVEFFQISISRCPGVGRVDERRIDCEGGIFKSGL